MAAWRPTSRNLVLVVNEPVTVHQPVQARITVLGHDAGATIVGSAASVNPHPLGVEVELAPDALRAPTLEGLVARVRSGARGALRPRPPRWLAEVPACVYRLYHFRRTCTFSVSEDGVGLRWSGEMPPVGATVQLHLGTSAQFASFCGEVRWTSPTARAPAVGVRLDAGDRDAWRTILTVLRHAGAPSADPESGSFENLEEFREVVPSGLDADLGETPPRWGPAPQCAMARDPFRRERATLPTSDPPR